MPWHHRVFNEGDLSLVPTRDGTERSSTDRSFLPVSVRPAAAFCDVDRCHWSCVWVDESGALGLVLTHYADVHGRTV